MKAKPMWSIAAVLFLSIYQPATAQGQTEAPKPSGDVWTGVPVSPPGGPYPIVVVVKDLPPPKASPDTKPVFVRHFGVKRDPVLEEEALRRANELRAKTPPEELPKPPLPPPLKVPAATQAPSPSSSAATAPRTPALGKGFFPPGTASEDAPCNNRTPSDMGIAASRSFVVQVTNSCFRVFDAATGTQLSLTGFTTFFSRVATDLIGDPRALYDPAADRFIVIAGDFTPTPNLLLVAASQSGDPTLGWNLYSYPMGSATQLADFPTLGQSLQEAGDAKGAIYVGFNLFDSAGFFQGSQVYALPKSPIYAGTPQSNFNITTFSNFNVGGVPVDTLQPVNNLADRPRAEFAINSLNINFGGGSCAISCNGLVVWAFTNGIPLSGGPPASMSSVSVSTGINYTRPPKAVQPGCTTGSCLLDTGDTSITGGVTFAGGSLWASLNTSFGVALWELHPTLNDSGAISTAVIRNEICFACSGFVGGGQAYYATIQPDSEGNFTMVYNFSDVNTFPSAIFLSRRATQAQNTLHDSGLTLAAGLAGYNQPDANLNNRWGDYTGAALSQQSPNSYWFSAQFAQANGNWGTAIGLNGYTDPSQP